MQEIHARQVVVTHRLAWGKWPSGPSTDYEDVLAQRWTTTHLDEEHDVRFVIENRFLPVYAAYVAALPEPRETPRDWPILNNLIDVPPSVVSELTHMLEHLSKWCDCLLWEHARCCYPVVAERLPNLFTHRCLTFGDDFPGWNERRTYPVAPYFTSLIYNMFTVAFGSGQRTANAYAEHGLDRAFFHPCGLSGGFGQGLKELGFSVEEKADRIRAGNLPALDLVFVGMFAGKPWRGELLQKVFGSVPAGIQARAHGQYAPGGILPGQMTARCGHPLARLYANTLFGINPQLTSLYNTRLMDLWHSGVAQLIYDPHGELAAHGFEPGRHFIAYDGTAVDFWKQLSDWRSRPADLADLLVEAHAAAERFLTGSVSRAYASMYYAELHGRLEGE